MSGLLQRLSTVLAPVAEVIEEYDDALTVRHDDTVASFRVVALTDELELISLTQILAWDLPLSEKTRRKVSEQTAATLLGTVALVADPAGRRADAMLRYSFPAAGLSDDALRTLVLVVLAAGADVRRVLAG